MQQAEMNVAQPETSYLGEQRPAEDLGRQALRGGVASIVSRLINGGIQIGSAIALARLLAPEDFGLVAMVNVLTGFAPLLIDCGLGDATTQKAEITQGEVSCLFWISTGIGLALTILMACCSPLIALMYRDPRLQAIAMIASISFVLLGLSGQHMALLRRRLQFARVAGIEIGSNVMSVTVAIGLAAFGFGYWGLVLRPIVASAGLAVGAWAACSWRPGWPAFDSEVKKLVRFGMHVVGFTLTYTAGKAADRFALGLRYLPREVGFYQNALSLYENSILAVLTPIHMVGSAALSKLQATPHLLKQKYLAALSALAFYMMPAAAILSVVSVDIVVLLLGAKWRVAGSLLSIMALRGLLHVIEGSQGWLHLSTGRPDRWMKWGIVSAIVQVLAIAGGLPFGARGVAIGFVVSGLVIAFPSIMYAGRIVDIGFVEVLRTVGRQLIGAVIVVGAGWWLRTDVLEGLRRLPRVALLTVFCILIYLFLVVGVFRLFEPIRVGARLVWDHLPMRMVLKAKLLFGAREGGPGAAAGKPGT